MPKKPDERYEQAREMYLQGLKLVDISRNLGLPEGTVRRWKSTHNWDSERSDKQSERSQKNKTKKTGTENNVSNQVAVICESPDLSDKQRLFCCLYIKCFNATKAYQKAYGCSYETAMTEGSKCLRNPKIKKEIQKLKQNRLNKEMLAAEDIFQKYMDIAFSDITDYVSFGTEEVPVMAMYGPVQVKDEKTGKKKTLTQTINTVRFKESASVDGTIISEVKQGRDGASIKLADRMKALQWLSDHMDMATKEQQTRIEYMKLQTEKIKNMHTGNDDDGVVIINDAPEETS